MITVVLLFGAFAYAPSVAGWSVDLLSVSSRLGVRRATRRPLACWPLERCCNTNNWAVYGGAFPACNCRCQVGRLTWAGVTTIMYAWSCRYN